MRKLFKLLVTLIVAFSFTLLSTGCQFIDKVKDFIWVEDSVEDNSSNDSISEVTSEEGPLNSADIEVIGDSDFSIHFLELGNEFTGDSTYIKVGDVDILIDAGSRKNSASTIINYVDQFCTDNTLEYVIATHAHQDHIAGFIGLSGQEGVFEHYKTETIIDYPKTNATSKIKQEYEEKRDAENATHYTALECWNNKNGAKREYKISDKVTMSILYQKFYEEKSSDENNYSVCVLFTYKGNNYLFTGDLEKEGEESLVANNTLPKCTLFKGGHHGSPTSNTTQLLEVIDPDIVCVCCCCGSDEYTSNVANMFPSQQFVDNISKFTDAVYVTTIIDDESKFTSLNGNIIIYFVEDKLTLRCTNNNKKFKDTDWFKANRTLPNEWN